MNSALKYNLTHCNNLRSMSWTTPANKLDKQRGFARKLRDKIKLLLKIECNSF